MWIYTICAEKLDISVVQYYFIVIVAPTKVILQNSPDRFAVILYKQCFT